MMSIASTTFLHAEDNCVVAWKILTCVEAAQTIFHFRHPSSGPNMSSAASMSRFTIGQFGKRLFSTISRNFLRLGWPIVFCVFWARVACNTSSLEYLPLFSSTVFRIVSFSNAYFLLVVVFSDPVPHSNIGLLLTERMFVWGHYLGVLQTFFHFDCLK